MNKHLKIAIVFFMGSFVQSGFLFPHIGHLCTKNMGKEPARRTSEENSPNPSSFLINPSFEVLNNSYPTTENASISITEFFKQPDCKFIALEFWASWCPPCRAIMPILAKEASEWKKGGVLLIGVNIEGDLQKAKEMQSTHNIQAPWLMDNEGRLQKFFKVSSIPYMVVIDKEYNIVLNGHPSKIQDDVKKLLQAPTNP